MPLRWVRVDDRLIHGQVVVAWRNYLRFDTIFVVDDEVAGDPYLRDVLCLAAPAGLTVGVYTTAGAVSTLTASAVGQIVLLKRPETALALAKAGVPLPQLNVGNIAAAPGSRRVVGSISLTPAHVAALDALAGRGVCITFQATPDDPALDWETVRRRVI
jgi:mannose/fructose/N-acetylgalactosamine-specific phosphotransferase system component IIB